MGKLQRQSKINHFTINRSNNNKKKEKYYSLCIDQILDYLFIRHHLFAEACTLSKSILYSIILHYNLYVMRLERGKENKKRKRNYRIEMKHRWLCTLKSLSWVERSKEKMIDLQLFGVLVCEIPKRNKLEFGIILSSSYNNVNCSRYFYYFNSLRFTRALLLFHCISRVKITRVRVCVSYIRPLVRLQCFLLSRSFANIFTIQKICARFYLMFSFDWNKISAVCFSVCPSFRL